MRPKFLLDEHLKPAIAREVRRRDPTIDITYVGEPGAPPLRTPDPAILDYCEAERRILITNDRSTMPGHIADRLAAGRHYWGVLNTHASDPPIGHLVEEILLIAGASEAEEWHDFSDWIP